MCEVQHLILRSRHGTLFCEKLHSIINLCLFLNLTQAILHGEECKCRHGFCYGSRSCRSAFLRTLAMPSVAELRIARPPKMLPKHVIGGCTPAARVQSLQRPSGQWIRHCWSVFLQDSCTQTTYGGSSPPRGAQKTDNHVKEKPKKRHCCLGRARTSLQTMSPPHSTRKMITPSSGIVERGIT